ncbi:MAG: hypothetical protein PHO02_03865 [Candidatus Nanoarchaeia archaeon]|nr:hypothetical protein [Candidatus Nanoarchaeia archaeon]
MDEITSALENIAEDVAGSYKGNLALKQYIPSFGAYPFPSTMVSRISCLEEQTKTKFLGLIPYKKKKALVSVCETWIFIDGSEKQVYVTQIDALAEESARKHLAKYI